MDLNELDNSQMILLTLFVSFVTAIASGIVTVTLMEEAPQVVTQTVRQVVTKTVEKVVPQKDIETKVITKEKTVVVKESDLVAAAVQKNAASTVTIYKMVEKKVVESTDDTLSIADATETDTNKTPAEGNSTIPEAQIATPLKATILAQETETATTTTEEVQTEIVPVFLARGVILSSDGYIATDGNVIDEGIVYKVALPGVTETLPVKLIGINGGVAIVKVEATGLTPAKTATQPIKLGQSVVALMGGVTMRVANSIVSSVSNDGDIIGTNITGYVTAGAPLIDLEGDVIGLSTTKAKVYGDASFVFIDTVLSALTETKAQQSE